MKRYDPLLTPDPQEWLALDEQTRIAIVEGYHRRKHIRLPNVTAHALFHVIVENQIAMGDELPVKRKLEQLIQEGLDRHEALHAIASRLSNQIFYSAKRGQGSDPSGAYFAALEDLTAENWRKTWED